MLIFKDGTCCYRGVTYGSLREALTSLWVQHERR